MLDHGYLQIYTGNGKGKTTASLGVALRILGAGGRVYYAQFIKGRKLSSEFKALASFGDSFTYRAYGLGRFIKNAPSEEDIEAARNGLSECTKALQSGNYDLVVMDELNGAVNCKLISIEDVLKTVQLRTSQTELIITGRNARPELIELADLVTEMQPIKHYFEQGVPARTGIEM